MALITTIKLTYKQICFYPGNNQWETKLCFKYLLEVARDSKKQIYNMSRKCGKLTKAPRSQNFIICWLSKLQECREDLRNIYRRLGETMDALGETSDLKTKDSFSWTVLPFSKVLSCLLAYWAQYSSVGYKKHQPSIFDGNEGNLYKVMEWLTPIQSQGWGSFLESSQTSGKWEKESSQKSWGMNQNGHF